MESLFALLFVATTLLFILGMIKPKIALFGLKSANRLKVLLYLPLMLICLVVFAVNADKAEPKVQFTVEQSVNKLKGSKYISDYKVEGEKIFITYGVEGVSAGEDAEYFSYWDENSTLEKMLAGSAARVFKDQKQLNEFELKYYRGGKLYRSVKLKRSDLEAFTGWNHNKMQKDWSAYVDAFVYDKDVRNKFLTTFVLTGETEA